MLGNYQEETQPLFKLLRNEAFRFIIVRYNHYSLVQQLQKELLQRFPDRPSIKLNAQAVDYQKLSQAYYDLGRGFFFIENFDDLLKEEKNSLGQETPEMAQNNERRRHITAGLNLRRDKLAKYPIALIVFIGFSVDSLYAKKIMEKMPDLWSFRSLLLDLEMPLVSVQPGLSDRQMESIRRSMEHTTSSLGGTDKQAELKRLLELLAATPKNETAFRKTLYPQIADLQNDLGHYQAAIQTLQAWEKIANDDEKSQIWFRMGDIYSAIGDLQFALEQFSHVLQWAEKHDNKNGMAACYERLGGIYTQLGDLDKALNLYKSYNKLLKELLATDSSNSHFKNGLAASYSKLGEIYSTLGNLDKSLEAYQNFNRLIKQLYEDSPSNSSFKNGLAISYSKLGEIYTTLGQLDQALQFYQNYNALEKELYDSYPMNVSFKDGLAVSYSQLGGVYSKLGNLDKALTAYQNFNKLIKQLHEDNSSNVGLKNGLAISYSNLGETHAALGQLDQALQFYKERFRLGKKLYESYPTNVSFKNGLAISYSKLGDTHEALGQLDQALLFYQDFNALEKELYDSYPTSVSFKNGLAVSYAKLGQFSRDQLKNNTQAKNYFQQAEVLWLELVRDAPRQVQFQQFLANVQKELADLG